MHILLLVLQRYGATSKSRLFWVCVCRICDFPPASLRGISRFSFYSSNHVPAFKKALYFGSARRRLYADQKAFAWWHRISRDTRSGVIFYRRAPGNRFGAGRLGEPYGACRRDSRDASRGRRTGRRPRDNLRENGRADRFSRDICEPSREGWRIRPGAMWRIPHT